MIKLGAFLPFAIFVGAPSAVLLMFTWYVRQPRPVRAVALRAGEAPPKIFAWVAEAWRLFRCHPVLWLIAASIATIPYFIRRGPASILTILFAYRVFDLDPTVHWGDIDLTPDQWASVPGRGILGVLWFPMVLVQPLTPLFMWAGALAQVQDGRLAPHGFWRAITRRPAAMFIVGMGAILLYIGLSFAYYEAGLKSSSSLGVGFQLALRPFLVFVPAFVLAHGLHPLRAVANNVRGVARGWLRWVFLMTVFWFVGSAADAFLTYDMGVVGRFSPLSAEGQQLVPWILVPHLFVVALQIGVAPWIMLTQAVAFRDTFGLESAV